MARQFNVPAFYRSPVIGRVKEARRVTDPRKRDLSPSVLDFGPVRFKLARHFGFCYGVENAIEIAYRALDENPGRRLFLLSEMIHNPHVNDDLRRRGIRFLRTTRGEQLIPFDTLTPEDVVIIPAFGASLEVEAELARRGVDTVRYNTTCPFVEKVWKRSEQIGQKGFTVVVHGKRYHEETRATFSHAKEAAPVVVVRDLGEAEDLARVIRGEAGRAFFFERFADRHSDGFDPDRDLRRIGVVNQTTMLATETQAIADLLRRAMIDRYGEADLHEHFADTRDTLCYATNENQDATKALLADGGDLALIVGGYNSSNTSHLVELAAATMPAYFISGAGEIEGPNVIHHFDLHTHARRTTTGWLPARRPLDLVLTAGASCPDALLDEVLHRVLDFFPGARTVEEALAPFERPSTEPA
ncbi:4-hydroxy-3-methylbut-2-enyl diphosphate reductase [Rhodocaloribacter litoris]|uniref:4-hydroxy-3-methylbut-2-enyl diphosphate reductase n=1 Tax=Rhodocaloribacter litoris TaxID=2558931 RepID=UPI001420FB9A|nr:4-hydroxy-3-methylbut-2-enyl diphosphate reductase [Rhodocaloribacter litoris]QXD16751.1 4-hydroxy-3-methylbut-2-enyl diphosphate reductase [Rhodocaloribacter litoris]